MSRRILTNSIAILSSFPPPLSEMSTVVEHRGRDRARDIQQPDYYSRHGRDEARPDYGKEGPVHTLVLKDEPRRHEHGRLDYGELKDGSSSLRARSEIRHRRGFDEQRHRGSDEHRRHRGSDEHHDHRGSDEHHDRGSGKHYRHRDSDERNHPRDSNEYHRSRSVAPSDRGRRHRKPDEPSTLFGPAEHSIEKAISAAAGAAFHVRHEPGSWVGARGAKVVGAAAAAGIIDKFLNTGSEHAIEGLAVSAIQKAVNKTILNGIH